MSNQKKAEGKYRYLFKNVGVYTISQFTTKILNFFLVPLYTAVLTTGEYGTYDLMATTISLLIPIVTLNIADSILVFVMDKKNSPQDVLHIGVKYSLIGMLGSIVFSAAIYFTNILPTINDYLIFFPILLFLNVINSTLVSFMRGIDHIKETAIGAVISSAVIILLNILFLLVFKFGLLGYFLANILGLFVQSFYLIMTGRIWQYISWRGNKSLEAEMRKFSIPMIANSVSWWITSSSDKYFVTWICGLAENGIYSVGYKIPSILNSVETIFAQAWAISAIKEYESEDSKAFFSTMYSFYNLALVISCSFIIVFDKVLAQILYANDFYTAWKVVPFLSISIIFGGLSGFLGSFFAATKNTRNYAKSTIIASTINIILNAVLIPYFGMIGAAVATVICYFSIWIIRLIDLKKFMTLRFNIKRDFVAYIMLVIQTTIMLMISNNLLLYLAETMVFIFLNLLFVSEYKKLMKKLAEKSGVVKC